MFSVYLCAVNSTTTRASARRPIQAVVNKLTYASTARYGFTSAWTTGLFFDGLLDRLGYRDA